MKRWFIGAASAALLGVVGCGDDSKSDPMASLRGFNETQKILIGGNFTTPCSIMRIGGGTAYVKVSLNILNPIERNKDRYTQRRDGSWIDNAPYGIYTEAQTYTDPNCQDEFMRTTNKGEFVFSSDGKQLTVQSTNATIAAMNPDAVRYFNDPNNLFCGLENWRLGVEKPIYQSMCAKDETNEVYFLSVDNDAKNVRTFTGFICKEDTFGSDCTQLTFNKTRN